MIAHVRSKGWKRKRGGGKKHYQLCEQHPGQWRNVGINPQREEKKKKGKEAANYGEKKTIHAHFQRKKKNKEKGPPATESRPSAPRWGDVPRAENCRKKLHQGFGCVLWTYYLGSSRLVISIFLRLVNNLFLRGLWSEHYWVMMASCALWAERSQELWTMFLGPGATHGGQSPWETLGPRQWTHWWVRN